MSSAWTSSPEGVESPYALIQEVIWVCFIRVYAKGALFFIDFVQVGIKVRIIIRTGVFLNVYSMNKSCRRNIPMVRIFIHVYIPVHVRIYLGFFKLSFQSITGLTFERLTLKLKTMHKVKHWYLLYQRYVYSFLLRLLKTNRIIRIKVYSLYNICSLQG